MTEQKQPQAGLHDVKGELAVLWHATLGQIDEIRDVIVRGSQAGKAKLEAQLLKRQRQELLVQIGEAVINDHHRGVPLPPGCELHAQRLEDCERQLREVEREAAQSLARRGPDPFPAHRKDRD